MNLLRADRELTRNSYYAATSARTQSFPALQGTVECDLAVVGGGLAGLSAALEAAQAGMKVVLLEARHIGFGASGRNGGQAIHGLACEQEVIEAQLGPDEARRVWDLSIDALDLLRQRIRDHGIDCDWQDGYLGVAEGPAKGRALAVWADHIESRYAYPLRRIGAAEMPQWINSPRYHSAVHDPRSGHLHPLKYTRGLARAAAAAGVQIHEDSEVTALVQSKVCELSTAQGSVRAAQVLLAGNVYLQGLAPQVARAHHAGGHLHRLHRGAGCRSRGQHSFPAAPRCATTTSCWTTSAPPPTTACSTAGAPATAPACRPGWPKACSSAC